ncbi:hypothetical protein WME73_11925 [Sorangium sp. So ce302]|uniref:hypothetical protein n=1 Tax=Sorangium sp. So ce302 TaxID=3133297 RepID=UPI003F5FAD29
MTPPPAADAHARAVGLVMPPIHTSVERWCDYLVTTRFGATPGNAPGRRPASSRPPSPDLRSGPPPARSGAPVKRAHDVG